MHSKRFRASEELCAAWERRFCSREKLGREPIILLGTLGYEDLKARTAMAVDAGYSHESRRVVKNKMLKMCVFVQDGDVNNLSFKKALYKSNDILLRR